MNSLYQRVTDQIITAVESGAAPWRQSWSGGSSMPLRSNGIPYRGINILTLWCEATARGFQSPFWLTFKQALELGGNVKKGAKSAKVVYANAIVRKETNAAGNEEEKRIPFLKEYSVFNAEECENLPAYFYPAAAPIAPEGERIAAADAFFAATKATITHNEQRAYYRPITDSVNMPAFSSFETPAAYYAVLAHEIIHWTKPEARCGRDLGGKRFGDAGYALEELVAELGAAFTCALLGISPEEPRPDHASYIASWLKALKNDNKLIFTMARLAQQATDYLVNLQPTEMAVAA